MVVGSQNVHSLSLNFTLKIADDVVNCKEQAEDQGAWFNPLFTSESHVKQVTRTAFYLLKKKSQKLGRHAVRKILKPS